MGSGFVISEDGYIVTNNHVVEGAEEVLVRLSDRREYNAEIIGTDPRSDLALIKVDADDLPVLKLAPTDELEVDRRLIVIRGNYTLIYNVHYTIGPDGNGDRRRITPTIQFNEEGVFIKLSNS